MVKHQPLTSEVTSSNLLCDPSDCQCLVYYALFGADITDTQWLFGLTV